MGGDTDVRFGAGAQCKVKTFFLANGIDIARI